MPSLRQWIKHGILGTRNALAPRYYKLHETKARLTRKYNKTVLSSTVGADPNAASKRIAIFTHFDARGQIHDYVVSYVRSLREAGFRVWFVSNAPSLSQAAVEQVMPHVTRVLHRNNFGFDMGAYKDGVLDALAAVGAGEIEQLLLCNDSVYGPFHELRPLLKRASPSDADMWGMTESYEKRYHLQSYFVLFHRRVVESPYFENYWKSLPYVDARGWLIHHGEIALTQRFVVAGFSPRALFPMEAIERALRKRLEAHDRMEASKEFTSFDDRHLRDFRMGVASALQSGVPLNPTHFCWDILIADLQFPFIKRDLLQLNPVRIPGLTRWREAIANSSTYDVEQVRRHLLLRLKGRWI